MIEKKMIIVGVFLGTIAIFLAAKPLISPTINPLNWRNSWSTHTNNKYGHQFLFPANWLVEEWDIEQAANLKNVADGTILHQGKFFGPDGSPAGHFEILIWENKSKAPPRQWLTWFRHEDLNLTAVPQKDNFQVAGIPAIRFLQKETARKKPILYIFFSRDDKIYELTEEREDLAGSEATQSARFAHPVFDKILESFQFMIR